MRPVIAALARAAADLFAAPLRRVVLLSLALALVTFVLLWIAVGVVLGHAALFAWRPLNWLVDLLGALAVLALSWLLFPAVVTMVMGFFLDRVAGAVEVSAYPGQGPPRRASIAETIWLTVRLMGLSIVLNLLALPLYVLLPGLNFFVFLGLNGYLFGRTYFEVVAMRRLDPLAARALRRYFAGRVFLGGLAVALLFAIPLLDLLTPVIATALMVHLFEGVRQARPQRLAS